MNAQINEVKITMTDGSSKRISVDKNGMILVIGSGPYAGAFRVKLEEATQAELEAADGIVEPVPVPFDEKLQQANEELQNSSEYSYFNSAVDFLAHCKGEDFLELVRYARAHGNRFFNCVKEVADCVNADDAYCSALILLSRPLGEVVEQKAFELFAKVDESDLCEENFLDFWKALQTISYFCG